MRIAIPRMGEVVAPCFEYCATMAIFTVADGRIVDQVDFPLKSRDPFDRVRLLRDREVDALICGGMQDIYEDLLRAGGLQVVSWVSGPVEDLLALYVQGRLAPGMELPERGHAAFPGFDTLTEH